MDFHLSKEHEMLRKMYREFAQNEVCLLYTSLAHRPVLHGGGHHIGHGGVQGLSLIHI